MAPTTNPHQQLGAFTANVSNLLAGQQIEKFSQIGAGWVAPVIFNDHINAPPNFALLDQLKTRLVQNHLTICGWFNVFGGDPAQDAQNIAKLTNQVGFKHILVDAENAYGYPGGNPTLLPILFNELRRLLPNTQIAHSGLGPNSAFIYNGRTLPTPKSYYDLGIRHYPQWYDSYYSKSGRTPQYVMQWLKANGATDFNFKDITGPKNNFGLPLSYVHPTVEATGLEGSNLNTEMQDCKAALAYGLTPGMSYYLLENAPNSDFTILNGYKNILWLPRA